MNALDLLRKALLGIGVLIVIALLSVVLFAISAAIGGAIGYALAYVYVNWLGLSLATLTLTEAALIGSIVNVLSASASVANSAS